MTNLSLKRTARRHDEALAGEWKGYRSSRLGLQYRVIYRVLAAEMLFQVVSVTAHDYRRT
jgi:mRNA-degrading endonuclease YafQ of YafQ-DinJ toxin-antitoxin module